MSDKSIQLFLTDFLKEYTKYRKIFLLQPGAKTILVSIDDIFHSLLISNKLVDLILTSDMFEKNKLIGSIGDSLFEHADITEYIFKVLFNDTVHYFIAKEYESNVLLKIPDNQEAIDTIKFIAAELNLCVALYDDLPRANFEKINLNKIIKENHEKFSFIELIDVQADKKMDKWEIFSDKLYVNTYKPKHWINFDLTNEGKTFYKRILRWRWYKLLLPLAVFNDCINTPYLNHYIWKETKQLIKLDIDLNILYKSLKVFPLQLVGVTNNVLFRQRIFGDEDWLHNWDKISNNSCFQWTRLYNYDYHLNIFKLIHFERNYNGNNYFESYLRRALIYLDAETLRMYNFPLNLHILEAEISKIWDKDKKTIWLANLALDTTDKVEFIDKYLNII